MFPMIQQPYWKNSSTYEDIQEYLQQYCFKTKTESSTNVYPKQGHN